MMWFQCIQEINMKKIIALLFVATFATSASAAMTQTCQDYYKEIDNFMNWLKTNDLYELFCEKWESKY